MYRAGFLKISRFSAPKVNVCFRIDPRDRELFRVCMQPNAPISFKIAVVQVRRAFNTELFRFCYVHSRMKGSRGRSTKSGAEFPQKVPPPKKKRRMKASRFMRFSL